MDKKIVLSVISVISMIIVILAIAILIPGGKPPDSHPKLPWETIITADNRLKVFGLTLGISRLKEAQELLQDGGETSLFITEDNALHIESYFKRIALSGIRATFVITLAVDPAEKQAIYQRGLRIKRLETGNRQVLLTDEDLLTLSDAIIDHITYIPIANLDEGLVESRFGKPTRKIPEGEGIVHWLYPGKGMDIALNMEGKEIIQYVNPDRFDQVMGPLLDSEQNSLTPKKQLY